MNEAVLGAIDDLPITPMRSRRRTREIDPAHQAANIRYWDSVSARYLELFRDELSGKPFDLALLRKFANSLGPGGSVCDVGCGPCAHITRLLADSGLNTVGIDLSPACIHLARQEQPSLDLRVMDAASLEFPESSFNGLVAYYLLHYLPKSSWPSILAGFSRVLRPGGQLLIVMKKGEGERWVPDPIGGDVETFWAACSHVKLESMIAEAGFLILDSQTRCPLPKEIAIDRIYLQAECVKPCKREVAGR